MHAVLACKVAIAFFNHLCLNNHSDMAGTDQYYMHLIYLCNTDVVSVRSTLTMVVLQVVSHRATVNNKSFEGEKFRGLLGSSGMRGKVSRFFPSPPS